MQVALGSVASATNGVGLMLGKRYLHHAWTFPYALG